MITDSSYVVKGMTEWIKGWIRKKWMNSQKKPVMNRDLWEALLELSRPIRSIGFGLPDTATQGKRKMRRTCQGSHPNSRSRWKLVSLTSEKSLDSKVISNEVRNLGLQGS